MGAFSGIRRNFRIGIVLHATNVTLTLAISILLVHLMGQGDFGVYLMVLANVTVAITISVFGTQIFAIREISASIATGMSRVPVRLFFMGIRGCPSPCWQPDLRWPCPLG